jgi:hypothetical protein
VLPFATRLRWGSPMRESNLLNSTTVRPLDLSTPPSPASQYGKTRKRRHVRRAGLRSQLGSNNANDSIHNGDDGDGRDVSPLVVKPRGACVLLQCGVTKLYQLLNAGELESFLDGKSRKITTRSIRAYVARHLESAKRAT